MSVHGHYTHQYYGNRVDFPTESFLISGSTYINENNYTGITFSSELVMKTEFENEYDNTAIAVYWEDKKMGYVPNVPETKETCLTALGDDDRLKVINLKKIPNETHRRGIRVIPAKFYIDRENDELKKQVLFGYT